MIPTQTSQFEAKRLPLHQPSWGTRIRLRLIGFVVGSIVRINRWIFRTPLLPSPAHESPEQILIVRLDGLGDMILFSGFFRECRRTYPSASITLVTNPAGAEIMGSSPYIDRIVTFQSRGPKALRPILMPLLAWWFSRQHLEGSYSMAIQPRWDLDGAYAGWIIYMSGAAIRVGYSEHVTARKAVFNHGMDRLYTTLLTDTDLKHEADRAVDILGAVGGKGNAACAEVSPQHHPNEKSGRLLLGLDTESPIVAVSPSGGHSPLKAWPLDRFAAIIPALVNEYHVRIVLLGSQDERGLADQLVELAAVPIVNLVGQLTLAETANVLDLCTLFLGNDTGLLHLAVARQLRTVSIYGSSPAMYFGPRGPRHRVIWNRLPCGPLPPGATTYQTKKNALPTERCTYCIFDTPKCMEGISTDVVLDACRRSLMEVSETCVPTPSCNQ